MDEDDAAKEIRTLLQASVEGGSLCNSIYWIVKNGKTYLVDCRLCVSALGFVGLDVSTNHDTVLLRNHVSGYGP